MSAVTLRSLSWPADRAQLERLDTAFTTAVSHRYVERAERGHGVGTGLLRELRDRARALHARHLWVETQNVNAPAIRFYERCGWTLSGLDTSLYDPRDIMGETALFFTSPIADE
jgi:GNAT superfamily N-acetyltransferase